MLIKETVSSEMVGLEVGKAKRIRIGAWMSKKGKENLADGNRREVVQTLADGSRREEEREMQ